MSVDMAMGAADARAVAAVEMRGISRRFGAVVACDGIDLLVHRGEITGLLGENGAGKSTLMNVLLGLVRADAGSILLDGRTVQLRDAHDAAAAGLGMVHQHFSLIEPLTVWENVTLGERGRIDQAGAIERVERVGRRYGLDVDPGARVRDLSVGERQRVEIVKCLAREPTVVVLDEPTSVLTVAESRELFRVLRHVVRDEDRAVILISHKLDEIVGATDTIVVLRRGRVIAHHRSNEIETPRLAREMVGREVSLRDEAAAVGVLDPTGAGRATAAPATDSGHAPLLRIHDAHAAAGDGRPLLHGLSLTLRTGEILGIAGVAGNGQTALEDVLSSLVRLRAGTVAVRDLVVPTGSPGAMQRAGIAVIPEDRHRSGCVLDMSVADNLVLGDVETHLSGGLLSRRSMRARAHELIERFGIECESPRAPFGSLSGGNQQRALLARELSRSPAVLVAAHPLRGLDVGAIEYMTASLRDAARRGAGVLLISSELGELVSLADRIAVIHRGRIVGEMTRAELDVERLGMLMGGQAA